MRAGVDSPASRVARSTSAPSLLSDPAATSSPARRSAGMDSPVMCSALTSARPCTITPSSGTWRRRRGVAVGRRSLKGGGAAVAAAGACSCCFRPACHVRAQQGTRTGRRSNAARLPPRTCSPGLTSTQSPTTTWSAGTRAALVMSGPPSAPSATRVASRGTESYSARSEPCARCVSRCSTTCDVWNRTSSSAPCARGSRVGVLVLVGGASALRVRAVWVPRRGGAGPSLPPRGRGPWSACPAPPGS